MAHPALHALSLSARRACQRRLILCAVAIACASVGQDNPMRTTQELDVIVVDDAFHLFCYKYPGLVGRSSAVEGALHVSFPWL